MEIVPLPWLAVVVAVADDCWRARYVATATAVAAAAAAAIVVSAVAGSE